MKTAVTMPKSPKLSTQRYAWKACYKSVVSPMFLKATFNDQWPSSRRRGARLFPDSNLEVARGPLGRERPSCVDFPPLILSCDPGIECDCARAWLFEVCAGDLRSLARRAHSRRSLCSLDLATCWCREALGAGNKDRCEFLSG